ncbi:MAG: hypothetical protein AB8F74_10740 [Saprospiraceae bacterium]
MSYINIFIRCILFSVFLIMGFTTQAQLHFKVGYSAAYFEPEVNNNLLQAFNERNPWLDDKFNDLNWSHSLDAGIRYRIGFVGLEASWKASFADVEAEGRTPSTNAEFLKRFLYRFNSYTFGVENYIGNFGFGANLGYNRMTVREKNSSDRFNLLKTDQWIGTVFLGIYTNHDGYVSFGIRPFVQLPLSQFDISGLATSLDEPNSGELLEKEYMTFGISLVIFNGH